MTGCFGTASSATANSLRVPSHPTPKGAPPARPLQALPTPSAGFACTEQLSTRLELRGVLHQENPTPCKPRLILHIIPPLPCVHGLEQVGKCWVLQKPGTERQLRVGRRRRDSLISAQTLLLVALSHTEPLLSSPCCEDECSSRFRILSPLSEEPSLPSAPGQCETGGPKELMASLENPLHSWLGKHHQPVSQPEDQVSSSMDLIYPSNKDLTFPSWAIPQISLPESHSKHPIFSQHEPVLPVEPC